MQLPTGTELFQPDHYYSGWPGGWVGKGLLYNKANSVQLQLPTGTEFGNKVRKEEKMCPMIKFVL